MLILLLLLLLLFRTNKHTRHNGRRITTPPTRRHSRRKPAWVRREVIRLKALSDQSCRKLAATFNRKHAASRGVSVGKTWVAEVVRAHHYEIAQPRQRYKHRVPPPLCRNATWGLDFTGKSDASKTVYPVFGIIDHGSRMALALQPLRNRTSVATLRVLLHVIETFGTPAAIRTDNDATFTSRLFRFSLRWLGIRHRLSTPGAPWQNGRIERLFGTLKEKLNQLVVADFANLGLALADFRFWYNHVRPHQHLNGWTPAEALQGLDPYATAPKGTTVFSTWDGLLEGMAVVIPPPLSYGRAVRDLLRPYVEIPGESIQMVPNIGVAQERTAVACLKHRKIDGCFEQISLRATSLPLSGQADGATPRNIF